MGIKKVIAISTGALIGAAAGFAAGVLAAPRTGAESRAMAADAINDAWDSAVDTYERGARVVNDKINSVKPSDDAATDELRAKVDLARERMDQLRDSLSDAVTATSEQVQDAVSAVQEKVTAVADEAVADAEAAAEGVQVEVVDEEEPAEGAADKAEDAE